MSALKYIVQDAKSPIVRVKAADQCIYCDQVSATGALTDEHVIPDGLGGNLILPRSSCEACAVQTCRIENHFITEALQFPRSVAGVRSRKRRPVARTIKARRGEDGLAKEIELPLDSSVPFIFPFITTDGLPGVLSGARPGEQSNLRISVFGSQDWNHQGKRWLGSNGSFRFSHRLHPGVVGQALAKIAHAYACSKIGLEAFVPFLREYILAREPAFEGYHIGCHGSHDTFPALHYIDLQRAKALRWTALGTTEEWVYVVYLRLFADRPSPSFLIVVGRPKGALPSSILTFNSSGSLV